MTIRRSIQDVYGEGADNYNYGLALLRRERNEEALPYFQRARDLYTLCGLLPQVERTDRLIAQARGVE